eukprot:g3542.t1
MIVQTHALDPGSPAHDVYHTKLKDFQRVGVDFIVQRAFRCLLADDMGTGKTVQALCAACFFREKWPVLVLCPKNALPVWSSEIEKWFGKGYMKQVVDSGGAGVQIFPVDFVIMTHDLAKKEKLQKTATGERFRLVIVDEAHKAKNDTAARAQ